MVKRVLGWLLSLRQASTPAFPPLPDVAWRAPWGPIPEDSARRVAAELRLELGPDHALRGQLVRAVAWRRDQDDVLFQLGHSVEVAVVHLTWKGKAEPDPLFPETVRYRSLQEWVARGMGSDADDWET